MIVHSSLERFVTTATLTIALTTISASALAQAPPTETNTDAGVEERAPRPLPPQKSKLTIAASPSDATIMMNQNPTPIRAGSTLELEPGTYEFTVTREGYKTRIETVVIGEGAPRVIMSVNLSKTDPDTLLLGRTGGLVDNLGEARKPIGWSSLVVGVGLTATGITLAALSGVPDSCSQLDPAPCGDARDLAGVSMATGALGGALVAGGLGLLIWDSLAGQPASDSGERTDPQVRRTLRLAPRFSPGADAGAGLTFELGF